MDLETLRRTNWDAGVCNSRSPYEIAENQLVKGDNCLVEKGAIIKAGFYSKLTGSAIVASTPVLSIYEFYKESSGASYLLANCGTKIVRINTGTGAITNVATGLTSGYPVNYATINNKVYMTNSQDAVVSWDGSSLDTPAGCTVLSKYVIVHKDKMFFIATTANPNMVYFSDAGDPETIGADNHFEVYTTDGDILTGAISLFGYLFLFKNYSIHRLSGYTAKQLLLGSALTDAFPGVGGVANTSISHVAGGAMFYGVGNKEYGIYYLTPENLYKLSGNIPQDFLNVSISNRAYAGGCWDGKRYRLSFPRGAETYPELTWIGELKQSGSLDDSPYMGAAWTRFTYGMTCYCVSRNGTIYAGGSDGFIYKIDSGLNAADSEILMSALMRVEQSDKLFSIKKGEIQVNADGTVRLGLVIDRGKISVTKSFGIAGEATTWGENNWAIDTGTVTVVNGSTTVTADGNEDWSLMQTGDSFLVDGDSTTYTVQSVNTGAHTLVLTAAYAGSDAAGATYVVWNDETLMWGATSLEEQRFSYPKGCNGRNFQLEVSEKSDNSEVKIYGVATRYAILTGEK